MLCFYLARLILSKKLYGTIPEKNPNRGVEDMEFPSRGTEYIYYINRMRKFLGLNTKRSRICCGNPEEIIWNSNGLGFWPWKFQCM